MIWIAYFVSNTFICFDFGEVLSLLFLYFYIDIFDAH